MPAIRWHTKNRIGVRDHSTMPETNQWVHKATIACRSLQCKCRVKAWTTKTCPKSQTVDLIILTQIRAWVAMPPKIGCNFKLNPGLVDIPGKDIGSENPRGPRQPRHRIAATRLCRCGHDVLERRRWCVASQEHSSSLPAYGRLRPCVTSSACWMEVSCKPFPSALSRI